MSLFFLPIFYIPSRLLSHSFLSSTEDPLFSILNARTHTWTSLLPPPSSYAMPALRLSLQSALSRANPRRQLLFYAHPSKRTELSIPSAFSASPDCCRSFIHVLSIKLHCAPSRTNSLPAPRFPSPPSIPTSTSTSLSSLHSRPRAHTPSAFPASSSPPPHVPLRPPTPRLALTTHFSSAPCSPFPARVTPAAPPFPSSATHSALLDSPAPPHASSLTHTSRTLSHAASLRPCARGSAAERQSRCTRGAEGSVR